MKIMKKMIRIMMNNVVISKDYEFISNYDNLYYFNV